MSIYQRIGMLLMLLWGLACQTPQPENIAEEGTFFLSIPYTTAAIQIDGTLDEWKQTAFCDGWWDLDRLRYASWYDPKRNRLADHGEENTAADDLAARYYIAWSDSFLYLGAEVRDNVNDVSESRHAPKRWYYKDAVTFFIEAPLDTVNETFAGGDHGFAFVIDSTRPDYGAWWRHGTADSSFIEEALPAHAGEYAIRFDPWGRSPADYVLEARIALDETFAEGDPAWTAPKTGDRYRLMIVHCDPDGGEYGGHLLIYGKGDPDESWTEVRLSGELEKMVRKEK